MRKTENSYVSVFSKPCILTGVFDNPTHYRFQEYGSSRHITAATKHTSNMATFPADPGHTRILIHLYNFHNRINIVDVFIVPVLSDRDFNALADSNRLNSKAVQDIANTESSSAVIAHDWLTTTKIRESATARHTIPKTSIGSNCNLGGYRWSLRNSFAGQLKVSSQPTLNIFYRLYRVAQK